MNLSEAMRLGSMLKPQAFGDAFIPAHDLPAPGDILALRYVPSSTCAVASAFDAIGALQFLIFHGLGDDATKVFPVLGLATRCPLVISGECNYGHGRLFTVANLIVHLNDCHRWKREHIADWLQGVESMLPAGNVTGVGCAR